MKDIINYLLGVDDGQRPEFDIRVGDYWIGVTQWGDGVFVVSCEPLHSDNETGVTFTDKLEALAYIQKCVSEVTDA